MPTGPELFGRLRAMDLPAGDYAVFGSGPLLARGVIEEAGDLDVVCRGPAWARAQELGEQVVLDEGVVVVSACDGTITFGRSWAYGDFDLDELIDTADVIDGLPFARMEYVIAFKRIAARPKDVIHLERLARRGMLDEEPGDDAPGPS